jgi:hypothetical protein
LMVVFADCMLAIMLSIRYSRLLSNELTLIHYLDVVKSRVQLRATPPTGTPVQYIARELKAIVAESGVYVPSCVEA